MPKSNRRTSPTLQDESVRVYHTRFQTLEQVAALKPGSAQLILTDPPYNRDWLPQWGELAALATRLLVTGGLFVTYTGKYYLAHVMGWLSTHLTYRWMMSSYEEEVGSLFEARHVMGLWKPVLVYSNGPWINRDIWPDVLCSPKEKSLHSWQQPLIDAELLVSYFSNPTDLVIDPCAGSFTVAEACLRRGRRCVSCDSEEGCVTIGKDRLAQAHSQLSDVIV